MKLLRDIKVNCITVNFEIDTGSPVVLIDQRLYETKFQRCSLKPYHGKLFAATGNQLHILGCFKANVTAGGRSGAVDVCVCEENRPVPLLGEPGLDLLFPNWRSAFDAEVNTFDLNNFNNFNNLDDKFDFKQYIKTNFFSVCDGDLTEPIREVEVDLHFVEDAVPRCARPYTLPHHIREEVKRMLDDMVTQGIIRHVTQFQWASPIVIVRKPNGAFRICINPSKTLNPCLLSDNYNLPTAEGLFVEIGGHKYYTKLDLKGAFQQLLLSPSARKLVVITTPFGAYEFLRLPFGVKPASAIFQRVIQGSA